jgi:CRP-like cAMP-binding protein
MERHEALRRVLFLKPLPEAVRQEIACAGYEKALHRRGELLFSEHDRCIGLIVVLSGAVRVHKIDSRGREMTLAIDRPGDSVADLSLFDGGNYPASAEAHEDDTRLFIVPRDRFQALTAVHPEIAAASIRALAVQMRKLIEMLKAQSLHTVSARIAGYLLQAAGDEVTFSLRETNEAIGSQVGTVREVVSRTLHGLADAGAIRLRGRTVTILCRDVLCRIAFPDDTE